ncbi:MAG: DNA polymerase III subunit alpha, partial [Pseudomonadota bacterium]|nr:DNA polymerase III subunit alpha [Pseudomonadota bacterium]
MDNQFVHLKTKSHYSILESSIKVDDLINRAVEDNMSAIALTDTNNLFGAMEFTKKALAKKIKPILGADIVFEYNEKSHNYKELYSITCLIMDDQGWKNLSILVSNLYKNLQEYKYKFVSLEDLIKYNEGLLILFDDVEANTPLHKDSIFYILGKKLKSVFGNRMYLSLFKKHKNYKSIKEKNILELSIKLDISLVCTNNVSFLNREMLDAQDCLMCIDQATTITDSKRKKPIAECYFKNTKEMLFLFNDMKEVLINTVNISKRCNFLLKDTKPKLPNINISENLSESELIYRKAYSGLKKRIKNDSNINEQNNSEYFRRLDYELEVINNMGYAGYFLIVSDFIIWAKNNSIPVGPGRGSGAGSIVAWALNITDIDPIRYGLLFERFLNPSRISLPDFDVDFCKHRREEVIEYVRNKYGRNKVAQIITFGSLQARAVIRDVGRVLGLNYGRVDKIAKLIPNNPGAVKSLKHYVENDSIIKNLIEEDDEVRKVFNISIKLEGLNRNASTHAAGLVISNSPIVNDVPLYYDAKSSIPVSQFNMKYLENIGLIKFDFLGLETLSVLDATLKLIKKRNIDINLNDINYFDKKTYSTLSTGNTLGVFQLESIPMRQVLKQLKPDRIEDIIAVVALYRPGPMENIPSYINRKHKLENTTYPHPLLKNLLLETHGIMIYQEQVMEAARIIAGFSLAKADLLRRAMGKKIKSEMQALKKSFIEGSKKNNIPAESAKEIFSDIEKFAGYGFNKSHAAAYAMISYQTAWCKTHYPAEFFTALLNSEINNASTKYIPLKAEIEKLGLTILKSDINKSDIYFSVEKADNNSLAIRSGLSNIKNIGFELAKHIITERKEKGEYKSIFNFFSRLDPSIINKRQIEFLAMAGVFDDFKYARSSIFHSSSNLLLISQNIHKDGLANQKLLFSDHNSEENFKHLIKIIKPWKKNETCINEYLALGFLVSRDPLLDDIEFFKNLKFSSSSDIENNNINGKEYEILVFLVSHEQKSIGNSMFVDLILIDSKGFLNIRVFKEKIDEKGINLKIGETYVVSLIHALGRDGIMRLRFKTIIEADKLKDTYFKHFLIHLNNIKYINDIKEKLLEL